MPKKRLYYANLGKRGRLGNQLFQIASTIGIAHANDMDAVFPEWAYGSAFENRLRSASVADEKLPIYREDTFAYKPLVFSTSHIIDGFFQSALYFQKCVDEIRAQFTLHRYYRSAVDRLLRLYGYPDCSMHIRRGDYVGNARFCDLSTTYYYDQALSQLGSHSRILVFSDDPDWCQKRFCDKRMAFAEPTSDLLDLFLFSRCGVNIIANSSYSWWGAWLNCHAKPKVFAPERWFAGESADRAQPFRSTSTTSCLIPSYEGFHDTGDLVPASWIQLSSEPAKEQDRGQLTHRSI